MKTVVMAIALGSVVSAGCGDDDCCAAKRDAAIADMLMIDTFDAMPENLGFAAPTQAAAAFNETSPGTWQAVTADLSCVDANVLDSATNTAVSLTVTVRDFQSDNLVPGATVAVFAQQDFQNPFTTATANGSGQATVTLPQGISTHGYKLTSSNGRATFMFDQVVDPNAATQTRTLDQMSNATVATLPALVGVTAKTGSALVVGKIVDCAGHPLSNVIATVSNQQGVVDHLPGVTTYYFNSSVGLPVRHNQKASTDVDGLFMIIDIPPVAATTLQVWGFKSAADLASNTYTLLSRRTLRPIADAAYISVQDPRQHL